MGRHRHSSTPVSGRVAVMAAAAGAAVVIAGGWGAGALRETAPGTPAAVWSSTGPAATAAAEPAAPPPPTSAGRAPAPVTGGSADPPPADPPAPEAAGPAPEPSAPPSQSPTPTATGTPAEAEPEETGRPANDGLSATYATSETWEDGFQASISLANSAAVPAHAEVILVFPAGVRLRGAADCWWDVTCRQSGRTVTLITTSPLAPGTRRFIGFNAFRTPGSTPFEPVECTIDGVPCT